MIVGMPLGMQPFAMESCTVSHAANAFFAAAGNTIFPAQSAEGPAAGSSNAELHT